MDIKKQLQIKHEKIKNLSDSEINENLSNIRLKYKGINFCSNSREAYDFFYLIENTDLDLEDRTLYNFLLGRKHISYGFDPSNRKKSEALLTILHLIIN